MSIHQLNTKSNAENNTSLYVYNTLINDLLLKTQKPGQYIGIEWNHKIELEAFNKNKLIKNHKTWSECLARAAIIYPDIYELGMSNLGIKILYKIINEQRDYLCDRAYAPMKDMEELITNKNIPLWGWESFEALYNFDLLGFSLSYELSYTNVLNIFKLSHLNIMSKDRKGIFPIIFAGGPACFNPEPMADFIDFFIIGDGEEVILEILNLIKDYKIKHSSTTTVQDQESFKDSLLYSLAQLKGIYVPKFYQPDPFNNNLPKPIQYFPFDVHIPEKIEKRVVSLTDINQPINELVPYLATIHDRQVLEIRRGCDRGCRFCQPGYTYLPVRERTPDNLLDLSKKALSNTGYDEYSLLSLSASDTTCLHETVFKLNDAHANKGISLSMPSQRADRFDMSIANEINSVRKTGITLAPEAGSERLREVINKGLKEKDIKQAIENVYDSGFNHVKLYFMIGLPTETYKDLDGIIELLQWAQNLSKIKNKRPLNITCTISTFVPKPFTPFQWFSQNSRTEFEQKIKYLKEKTKQFKLKTVKLNCTDPNIALLEAVLSRGDRRISKLIYKAFKNGAKFDSWHEHLDINNWINAGRELNIDLDFEATKIRDIGETCPWEIIETGLLKKFLVEEAINANNVSETSPCTENICHSCGVCFKLDVLNEVALDKSKNNKFVKVIDNSKKSLEPKNSRVLNYSLPTKAQQKVEIIHTKTGNLKFISHLDLQKLFERALRRANITFSFTEGYNPRPKFNWLMPLPLFYESYYEVLHLELASYIDCLELKTSLNEQLPPEIQIKEVKSIEFNKKLPDIENIKVFYRISYCNPHIWEKYMCEVDSAIQNFLAKDSQILKIYKKNHRHSKQSENTFKEIEARPSVFILEVTRKNPPEINLVVKGNLRAELILNEISPKELHLDPENLKEKWQLNWVILKEKIVC